MSPSQRATAETDVRGHFVFVSLAPDTYTLGVAANGEIVHSGDAQTLLADPSLQTAYFGASE